MLRGKRNGGFSLDEMKARQLRSVLGAGSLLLLGVGCVIGAGIFVLPGYLASSAGPGAVISIAIAGGFCLIIALCYSELATALPSAGSAYAYTYVAMGRVPGWITGLLILLAYGLAVSFIAIGWSGYFVSTLSDIGITLPAALLAGPGGGGMNAPAFLAIAIATLLLCFSAPESQRRHSRTMYSVCSRLALSSRSSSSD